MEDDELDGRGGDPAAGTLLPGIHDELHFQLRNSGWGYRRVYVRGEFGGREFEREREFGRDIAGDGELSVGYLRDNERAELGD